MNILTISPISFEHPNTLCNNLIHRQNLSNIIINRRTNILIVIVLLDSHSLIIYLHNNILIALTTQSLAFLPFNFISVKDNIIIHIN